MSEEELVEKIMARRYDCFFSGYEPKSGAMRLAGAPVMLVRGL